MRSRLALLSALFPLLTGCAALTDTATMQPSAGASLSGIVTGGRQPITGARLYLLAASPSGYGAASTSLLTANLSGSDSIGGYVLTGAGGRFSLGSDYVCTAGQQIYLLALGGDPTGGTTGTINNTAIGLMTALGACPASGTLAGRLPNISVNEETTVAAAFALAGYFTDSSHLGSSGSTQANTGIANAMLTAQNLVSPVDGYARAQTIVGNGVTPLSTIGTLSNILAACINNNAATAANCTKLFNLTPSGGTTGTMPTDTATAIINIAHHPVANVAALYALAPGTASPYQPQLSGAPTDFSLSVVYPVNMGQASFDASGNLWSTVGTIYEFSNLGTLLSPSTGYTGGVLNNASGSGINESANNIAIDPLGSVWATSRYYNFSTQASGYNNFLIKIASNGATLSPSSGYTGGGLNQPITVAIDGTGGVFAGNSDATLSKFTNAGVPASATAFPTGGKLGSQSLAIDNSGSVWSGATTYVAGSNGNGSTTWSLVKLSNAGTILVPQQTALAGYNHLNVDAASNVWGTTGYNGNGSTQIFRLTSTGAATPNFPYSPTSAASVCLYSQLDGDGNFWCASEPQDSISEVSPSGTTLSPNAGYYNPSCIGAAYIAIDNSGNVWITNGYNSDTFADATLELIGAAAPVITPFALAVQQGRVGARP